MKFTSQIDWKKVFEIGITGVDPIDLILFDSLQYMIYESSLDGETINGVTWRWISYSTMIEDLPGLELTRSTVKRRLAKLVDAGLIDRKDDNEQTRKLYLSVGQTGRLLTRKGDTRFKNGPGDDDELGSKMDRGVGSNLNSNYTTINNPTIKNILTPSSQANGDGGVEKLEKPEKQVRTKKRITYSESLKFYQDEVYFNCLPKDPSPEPPDFSTAAGRERMIRDAYVEITDWMRNGDDETPHGVRDGVMTMGLQLTFVQFRKLIEGRHGLSRHQIKHYMKRLENYTDNKNKSVYETICVWHDMDVRSGKVPPRMPQESPTPTVNSMQAPKNTGQ